MVQKVLLDTNVLLEILLRQPRFNKCLQLLKQLHAGKLSAVVTNVAILSIAIVAHRKQVSPEKFSYFLQVLLGISTLTIENIDITHLPEIFQMSRDVQLDLEDSIQYWTAKKLALQLVTLDNDFKKTNLTIMSPEEVI